jgi:nucleoside-diphosphate-sugar epimerase
MHKQTVVITGAFSYTGKYATKQLLDRGYNVHTRPIYVEDMARLLVAAAEREVSGLLNAVGPETFTFEELVRLLRSKWNGWSGL